MTESIHGRIYVETLPRLDDVLAPSVIELLRHFRLLPILAVRPSDLEALPRILARLAGQGIAFGLWPMLSDDEGRWLSTSNVDPFLEFSAKVANEGEGHGPHTAELLLDLELPFDLVSAVTDARVPRTAFSYMARALRGFKETRAKIEAFVDKLHDAQIAASAAVLPSYPFDHGGGAGALSFARLAGIPLPRGLAHISPMAYTSILSGWSAGLVDRHRARRMLAHVARRSSQRWGERAGISLGTVGTGAFEDEPVLGGPSELAEDAAIARGAGVTALSLFDLGGVLRRGNAESWLDAFVRRAA